MQNDRPNLGALRTYLRLISEEDFLRSYPVDPRREPLHVLRLVEDATNSQDDDGLQHALLLGFYFGFPKGITPYLVRLLPATWHRRHEDIASILQKYFPDPVAVNALYEAALTTYPYREWDENYSLATKCIFALGAIGTDEGKEKLKLLAKSDIAIIREDAEEVLEEFFSRKQR